jgi:ParB family chromosome partitioning protein
MESHFLGDSMEETQTYAKVPVAFVREGFNYRRKSKADALTSLAEDIKVNGLIAPVVLRKLDADNDYQLLAGGRRFKAFVQAFGAEAEIPSLIRILTDAEATAIMMSENGQREDPSVIEDAEGSARMLGLCNGDRDEAAARLGWDRKKLDRRLALMNATQAVREAYLDEKISVGHVEILAALRKEVQDRVIEVILKADKIATVDQLKAMAEQSLQALDSAIFDRAECGGCQYNTGNQQALFEQSFSGSRCTNKECFGQKTEAELEVRKDKLTETYQVVRIVRPGDNSTVIPLRAEGKRPVGAEQATECRTCADFGACVSGVPDSLGKVYTDICFNQKCNDEKVATFQAQVKAREQAANPAPTGEKASEAGAAGASQSISRAVKDAPTQPKRETATTASSNIRGVVKEYREQIWRVVFERAVPNLPVEKNRALLIALIAHRSSHLKGSASMDVINKALGTDVPIVGTSTEKLMRAVMAFDKEMLGKSFQVIPAFVTPDMPIADLVGFLKALDINIEQFWKINETFFDILTKTEIDAVCQEIGLDKAAGKTYVSLKNGSKKDFVAAMLKVEGFKYLGAVPKMMRWTSGV